MRKRKERLSDHFGTEEEEQFSPAAARLPEETVNGVFLSLKGIIPGVEKT